MVAANRIIRFLGMHAVGQLQAIRCHKQFQGGSVLSVQTTERYLGCKQRLRNTANDRIGLEPGAP
jgi:hypothetical protein